MERTLSSPAAGWRDASIAGDGARTRLSDGWFVVLGGGAVQATLADGRLRLIGRIEGDLRLEVALQAEMIEATRSAAAVALSLDASGAQVERVGLIRRGEAGAAKGAPLWRRGDPIRPTANGTTLALRPGELGQFAALAAEPALVAFLGLTFAAGPIDLVLGSVKLTDRPEAVPTAGARAPRVGGLLQAAGELPDGEFADLLGRLLQRYAVRLSQRRARKGTGAAPDIDALGGADEPLAQALLALARAALSTDRLARAAPLLAAAAELAPGSDDVAFGSGQEAARAGRLAEAVGHFRRAADLAPGSRNRLELARTLRRLANQAAEADARTHRAEAIDLLAELAAAEPDGAAGLILAETLYEAARYRESRTALDRLDAAGRNELPALGLALRTAIALDDMGAAIAAARAIQAIDPANSLAAFQLRALRHFTGEAAEAAPPPVLRLDPAGTAAAVAGRLRGQAATWIAPGAPERPLPDPPTTAAGFAEVDGQKLWRADCLLNLLDSGLIGDDLAGLDAHEALFGSFDGGLSPARGAGTVVLMSRHGAVKFGGGEQFLESMAGHYRELGFAPLLVGTRPDMAGEAGVTDAGIRYCFVDDAPAALLRCLVEERATLVHAISGSGFLAAAATAHSRIRLVYGIHFWRELLGDELDRNFFDEAGAPLPRRAFDFIVEHATTIYCNSDYTRDLLERHFGVRAPTLYSVPADLPEQPA